MDHVRIPRNGWVLVCDGAKALTLHNEGDALERDLQPVDVVAHPAPRTSDLGTDRPGRVHQSHGAARSGVEQTDWHEAAEVDFLVHVAQTIDRAVQDHRIKALLVVAPPKALGILRGEFTDAVKAVITGELAKDLVGLPTHEIQRHLAA